MNIINHDNLTSDLHVVWDLVKFFCEGMPMIKTKLPGQSKKKRVQKILYNEHA